MVDEICEVVSHEEVGTGYRYLVLEAPKMAAELQPGQFVHIRVPALETSALRRPFSVFDAENGKVTLLYKTVGRGTAALNAVKAGDEINVLGPLGHGFPLKCDGVPLLVGGGYGVAPLHFLAKRLNSNTPNSRTQTIPKLFIGGRTAADLLALDKFKALGVEVFTATNDGSAGVKGLVTDPLDDELAKLQQGTMKSVVYSEYNEQFQVFGFFCILFLIIEICINETMNPFFTKFRIFKTSTK